MGRICLDVLPFDTAGNRTWLEKKICLVKWQDQRLNPHLRYESENHDFLGFICRLEALPGVLGKEGSSV